MRLFDNAAIKIDLFPGRKDKRNVKSKNASQAEQSKTTTPPSNNATHQAGQKSTVKEAKSLQNISRTEQAEPRYQRPNTSRSYNSCSTGRPSTEHSARANGYESQRPGSDNSAQGDDCRTYQAPWSSARHAEQDANRGSCQQHRPSTGDSTEYRDPSEPRSQLTTTRETMSQSDNSEQPSGDQRRSRADLQDEWMADQRLRTNIPKGAPHSTSHALKHKRSKADMIRATENMARTLSRSPHRSPANRRQLGSVDENRPGTSSSNGSSRLAPGQALTHSKGHQHTSSLSNAESSSLRQSTAERSSSAKNTDRDPLSPTKVSGVAKKQSKAFNSTIQVSPPLAMEPNKTTWSPTSSLPRKNDKTSKGRGAANGKNHGTHADHGGARAHSKDFYRDHDGNSNQRNSIDFKKSDHLSLAQREAYASSHKTGSQIPPVVERSNGAWNTHSRNTNGSSARSRSSNNEVQSKTVAINNGYSGSSSTVREEKSQSAHQTNLDQTGTTISSGISYMNYSRPTASDSEPKDANVDAHGSGNDLSGGAGVSSQVVDFANRAAKPASSAKQQGKKSAKSKTSGSQAPKSKYVDAASSTTSPFQTKFNEGMSDPRTPASHPRKASKNKFSNSSVVEKAHMSNASTTTASLSKQKKAAPPSLPIMADSQPRNTDTQGNGRAKVVTINNGGASAVVATPMDSAFTHDRIEERKDSGQSDSMDFGGKTTYSNQKEVNAQVAVSGN